MSVDDLLFYLDPSRTPLTRQGIFLPGQKHLPTLQVFLPVKTYFDPSISLSTGQYLF